MLDNQYIFYMIAHATEYILNLSLRGLPSNSVIIFDIDDTLIYNMTDTIINPVFMFYNWIKTLGIIPVIITARSGRKESILYTREQLQKIGISGYNFIFFRNPEINNIYLYKKNCRKIIQDKGYNILMSVGDMPWDIGEYGGYSILLRK
jgi:hypothetical protein